MGDRSNIRMPLPGEGWRHYKGGYRSLYTIVGVGTNTENGQPVVIYRPFGDDHDPTRWDLYVRPLEVFLASVQGERGHEPRFAFERPAPHPTASEGAARE